MNKELSGDEGGGQIRGNINLKTKKNLFKKAGSILLQNDYVWRCESTQEGIQSNLGQGEAGGSFLGRSGVGEITGRTVVFCQLKQ